MPNLLDYISDNFPATGDVGVPLRSTITITFSNEMDQDSIESAFFLEGPDTDQFVGPSLELLFNPDNISQGDDFLESPGYQGIVQGALSYVVNSGVSTQLIFTPSEPLAALTEYTAYITDITDITGAITYSGIVSFSFTTGSGAIQEVPETVSSSVLTSLNQSSVRVSNTEFKVVSTTPSDHAIEQNPNKLTEIEIEFNKNIDSSSVDEDKVTIEGIAASDHPALSVTANEKIAKEITVAGKKLIIRI